MLLTYMANPFDYQHPVPAPRLIDRLDELDDLQRAAADGVAVRLAAPRRFGKTSLLEAHIASMREAGHRATRVDLSKVATIVDVATRFAITYATLPGSRGSLVDRVLTRFGVTIGPGGISLHVSGSTSPPRVEHARAVLAGLLEVPRHLHESDGGLTVICLDEFQDLLTADDKLDGLLRSVIQHQRDGVAYVYAGSAPSLMRALFADRERPFFGQARPLELPVLPAEAAFDDIIDLAEEEGTSLDPKTVARLVGIGAGHPQRTMLLAAHLFDLTEPGEDATDLAALALDRAVEETQDVHQALWDGLRRAERAVMTALADGAAPTGVRTAEEHRISRASLQGALERLVAEQVHVLPRDGRPQLVDPLLREWLRRR